MNRGDLSNEQWERLQAFLPSEKPTAGRTALSHRQVLNGILWVLRTGAPWRDLPERYRKWPTIYSRFRRWQQAGVWARLLSQVQSLVEKRAAHFAAMLTFAATLLWLKFACTP